MAHALSFSQQIPTGHRCPVISSVQLLNPVQLRSILRHSNEWRFTKSWCNFDWKNTHVRLEPPEFVSVQQVQLIKNELLEMGALSVRVIPPRANALILQSIPLNKARVTSTIRDIANDLIDTVQDIDIRELRTLVSDVLSEVGLLYDLLFK